MNKSIFISLVFIFLFDLVINSTSKIDLLQVEKKVERITYKDSIQDKIKIDQTKDSNSLFISGSLDSVSTIYFYKKDTSNIIYNGELKVPVNLDSISKLWNSGIYDSLKITLSNSIEKIFRNKSIILYESNRVTLDSLSNKNTQSIPEKHNIEIGDYAEAWIIIVLVLGLICFIIVKKINLLKKERNVLEKDFVDLKIKKENHHSEINSQKENSKKQISPLLTTNIDTIKTKVLKKIAQENTLTDEELERLMTGQEHRWVTMSHSAVGKSHSQSTPPIPCQDNSYFESLDDKWQLAIVCDGAGSAKRSHIGSKLISNNSLPFNIKREIKNQEWFKKGELPSKEEWRNIGISVLKETKKNLKSWVLNDNKQNDTHYKISDYASTVMIALYNSGGVLIANIGDGRGGYLNTLGVLKPLFTPFGGEESNGTIFITTPIWKEPIKYIQTDVINEKILAVFLLSDGMEKITFECSNLTDNVFTDANIPFKKFFLPIFLKIKTLDHKGELRLVEEWKSLLESGNVDIKNESDDKTLLISFLK